MFDCVADGDAERKEQHLCDCEKRCAEDDVTDGPPVIESAEDEDELGDDIEGGADEGPKDINDP